MGTKREGNGLWGSRMLLPEHKSGIIREEREKLRRVKPLLDERKLEEIEEALALSLRAHVRVTVVVFDPFEDRRISGFVTSIHAHSRELKLQWAGDYRWISVEDIMEVSRS